MPWTSEPIELAKGMKLQVRVLPEGVDVAKQVGSVYASDILLTPDQANDLAGALVQAATKCRALRAQP